MRRLYLTDPIEDFGQIDGVIVSGGVGEYVYGREQRDSDREVELAWSDQETLELGAVKLALQRVDDPHYGRCGDCGVEIPFDRLKIEPQAMRCVSCESRHERKH